MLNISEIQLNRGTEVFHTAWETLRSERFSLFLAGASFVAAGLFYKSGNFEAARDCFLVGTASLGTIPLNRRGN